jgi:hypothetical protein
VTKFLEVYGHISYTEAREKVRTSGGKAWSTAAGRAGERGNRKKGIKDPER